MRRSAVVLVVVLALGQMLSPRAAGSSGHRVPAVILRSSQSTHRVVALTFDDGPSSFTLQILAILRRFHAVATFFVVGARAAGDPTALRDEIRYGDRIGNHTYAHVNLRLYSDAGVREQLELTQSIVRAATHCRPRWFRPPYGAVDQRVAGVAASLGLHTVLWSVDPRDWTLPGVGAIESRVLSAVRPGSIVLLHDGGGYRGETVEALPVILRALRSEGYRFITLHDMFFPRQFRGHVTARSAP